MPYRVQVQQDFDWRVGWVSSTGTVEIDRGAATSLPHAQAQAQAVVTRHKAKLAAERNALIYDQQFPD